MKIAITGASGLIGSALSRVLELRSHQIIRLVRSKHSADGSTKVYWNPATDELADEAIENVDAIINLAGETVAQRWAPQTKNRIKESRLKSTQVLVNAMASLKSRPHTFISASAIGIYGVRGDEIITEDSSPGCGFLAELCKDWEACAFRADDYGVRTVCLRTGIALSPRGGALGKILPPFLLGVGGILGSGKQYMSWISMDDVVEIIDFLLNNNNLRGPVNLVAPHPVTNSEFTSTLGKALGRPAILPVPSFALKLLFGEMAEEMLLGGTKVLPKKLEDAGYQFKHQYLLQALKHELTAHK